MSPNFNDRTSPVSFLILHYTGMKTREAAMTRLCSPDSEVSAHYLIDENGAVEILVPEEKRAWHAGVSYWAGIRDINSASIGIELVNPGHDFGYRPFPEAQMKSLVVLAKNIISKYEISPVRVLGHSDIAPDRKKDPGELFDWHYLSSKGIGVWPDAKTVPALEGDVKAALVSYGYDPSCDEKTLITAFQRHFYPEIFKTPEKVGEVDLETGKRLGSLLEKAFP